MIQGKSAGVQIIQNSSQPGGGISVRIRGTGSINAGNSPLYVIDGLPLSDSNPVAEGGVPGFVNNRVPRDPLNIINPADIASIEILKDASATSIYGARAANGVVLITTKTGSKSKMKVDYNGYVGFQSVTKKVDLLSAQEYQNAINDIIDDGGGTDADRVNQIMNGGSDWQDVIFRMAPVQNHGLTFSGGNNTGNYYVSLNYFDQEGVVESSGFERYTARLNFQSTGSDKFKFGTNITASYSKDDFVPLGFGINEFTGAIYPALHYDPTISARGANGNFARNSTFTIDNPLAVALGSDAIHNNIRTLGNVYGEYFIVPELSVKLNIGGEAASSRRDVYVDRRTIQGNNNGGIARITQGNETNYLVEGTVNYNKELNENHSLNTIIGFSRQEFLTDQFGANSAGFPSDATTTYALGLGDPSTYISSSNRGSYNLLSYFGRVNYGLFNKYLFTASLRADGSSRFGDDNKYGYFPSVALAWKAIEEDFIPDGGLLSDLKFRVSWGATGNQSIGNFNSIETLSAGPTAIINNSQLVSVNLSRVSNPDLNMGDY